MAIWQSLLCPFTIEFSADKLDDVRIAVIEGFYAVPHGGVEIGFVLYGQRIQDYILIEDIRKIETEYLTGPSFHPSENDKAGLRKLLAEKPPTGSHGPLQVVGWCHSHTRSALHLSAGDTALYNEFFPEQSHIALVLRPENLGPVRGQFFFRDTKLQITTDPGAAGFPLPTGSEKRPEKKHKAEPDKIAPAEDLPKKKLAEPQSTLVKSPSTGPEIIGVMTPLRIVLLVVALFGAVAAGYWYATHI